MVLHMNLSSNNLFDQEKTFRTPEPGPTTDIQSRDNVIKELRSFKIENLKKEKQKSQKKLKKKHKKCLSANYNDSPRFMSPIRFNVMNSIIMDNSDNGKFDIRKGKEVINKQEELRSVLAIFRHQDRSPKQKMKLKTTDPRFLQFFKNRTKEIKLKSAYKLGKILEIAKTILTELETQPELDRGILIHFTPQNILNTRIQTIE